MERAWTDIGSEYHEGEHRPRVEREIEGLTWKPVPEEGTMSLPFTPGEGIKEVVREFNLPRVSAVAHDGYLTYPDGPETAHFGVYGVESNYRNGRARLYVLDTGTQLVPLASDFWPKDS